MRARGYAAREGAAEREDQQMRPQRRNQAGVA